MQEKIMRGGGDVVIGGNKCVTLITPGPEQHTLFSNTGGSYQLDATAEMSGKLVVKDSESTFEGASRHTISPGDWGIVHIGDAAIFFQFVNDDAVIAAGSALNTLPYNVFATTLVAAFLQIGFVIACFLYFNPTLSAEWQGVPDRFVEILVDEPPDVIEEVIEEEAPDDETMSEAAGGEEGVFGEEDAEVEDSTLPDHDGPLVDNIETPELGMAFDAAIGMSGALTNVFGASEVFANTFGQDFATAGEGDAFVVGRGVRGLGVNGTESGGGRDGFGRVHGVVEIDTGGGEGQRASIGRRDERERTSHVETHRPTVNGFLTREQIERVVRRHTRGIRYCYERELQNDADLAGRISVNWTVGVDGRIESADITENSMGDSNVERCILREVRRMRFDQPDGGMVNVTFPFTFRSED